MGERNLLLTEHQERIIEDLVRSGRYQDASDVVREALRLLERQEAKDAARLEALRQAATKGIEAFDSGEYRQFESFDEIERYLIDKTEVAISRAAKR